MWMFVTSLVSVSGRVCLFKRCDGSTGPRCSQSALMNSSASQTDQSVRVCKHVTLWCFDPQTVVPGNRNNARLQNLLPDTPYNITVEAVYAEGPGGSLDGIGRTGEAATDCVDKPAGSCFPVDTVFNSEQNSTACFSSFSPVFSLHRCSSESSFSQDCVAGSLFGSKHKLWLSE